MKSFSRKLLCHNLANLINLIESTEGTQIDLFKVVGSSTKSFSNGHSISSVKLQTDGLYAVERFTLPSSNLLFVVFVKSGTLACVGFWMFVLLNIMNGFVLCVNLLNWIAL